MSKHCPCEPPRRSLKTNVIWNSTRSVSRFGIFQKIIKFETVQHLDEWTCGDPHRCSFPLQPQRLDHRCNSTGGIHVLKCVFTFYSVGICKKLDISAISIGYHTTYVIMIKSIFPLQPQRLDHRRIPLEVAVPYRNIWNVNVLYIHFTLVLIWAFVKTR